MEAVRTAGWRSAYAGILDPGFLAGLRPDPERVAARTAVLARPDAAGLVAAVDGEVVGAAVLVAADPGTVELTMLYVLREHWGTGLGHEFLEAGFAPLPRPRQVLWVLRDNVRARRFYERHGFAADGGSQVIDLGGPLVEVRYRRDT